MEEPATEVESEPVPEAASEETCEAVGNEVTIETEVVEENGNEIVVSQVTNATITYDENGMEIMEVETGTEGREHIIVTSLDNEHQVVIENVEEVPGEEEVPGNVMYVSSSVGVEQDEDTREATEHEEYEIEYQRPVRPVERQKMRPWLMELLDKANVPGLNWQNREKRIFRISWKHAAHNCFNKDKDSDLFERWAYHTGRHHEGNHKRWKANFRCALNSLPDVIELRDLGVRKGDNAFKVYKFIDLSDKKGQEEKKRQQVINAMTLKTRSKASASSSRQSKSESGSSDIPVLRAEGMLQTLLHAIELKNQEASQDGSPTTRTRASLKRTMAEKSQEQSKKRKGHVESSDDDGSVHSQDSSQGSTPGTPGTDKSAGTKTVNFPLSYSIQVPKSQGGNTSPGSKSESVITVPASLLSSLATGSGQIPLGISTPGGQVIQLSTLLAASLAQQVTEQKSPSPSKPKPSTSQSPKTTLVPIPKTVLESLKTTPVKQESEKSKPIKQETGQGDTVDKVQYPVEDIKVGTGKEWKSLAEALQSQRTIILKKSPQGTQVVRGSPAILGSQNIRSKLSSWLSQPVPGSTSLRMPSPQKITPITTAAGKPIGERIIIKPLGEVETRSTKIITRTSEPILVTSSPSAVVQKVEQLGDIQVNIRNLDPDATLVGSGPNTPQPIDIIPMMESVEETVTHTVEGGALSQNVEISTDPDTAEVIAAAQTATVATDNQKQVVVEEGTQQDIITKEVTVDLDTVDIQTSTITNSEKDVPQQLATPTRSARTQCDFKLANNQQSDSSVAPTITVTDSEISSMEDGESIVVASKDMGLVRLSKVGDYFTISEEVVKEENTDQGPETESSTDPGDILQQAMNILSSSPVYRTFSYKLIKTSSNAKSLIINNNWYFGVLGEDVDPLTVTLTSTGQLTISIIFKHVEKMTVLRPQGDFDEDMFRSVLDQMTRNQFCPGIPQSKVLPECNMDSVVVLSHPFLRYQSMDCPVWFEGQDSQVSTVPVRKCPSCHELFKLLGRQVTSIKRKKRKQEELQEIEDEAYREEVNTATSSVS